MSKPQLDFVIQKAEVYRKRLRSISWFMKKSSGTIFQASPAGVSLMDETKKCSMSTLLEGLILKMAARAISGKAGLKAKPCWPENAPTFLLFSTSMWLDEQAFLTCMAA
ncbi:hypothetical protein ACFODZ_07385 [Marinicella sediminis]|uniref:Uncharacterized protein n=1 Tax=Marinicella sediminis TaxID=1792834 RepID=A0ABV7J7F7_9GAMM|nr:hypothetical protein [Marinicella sediminis]